MPNARWEFLNLFVNLILMMFQYYIMISSLHAPPFFPIMNIMQSFHRYHLEAQIERVDTLNFLILIFYVRTCHYLKSIAFVWPRLDNMVMLNLCQKHPNIERTLILLANLTHQLTLIGVVYAYVEVHCKPTPNILTSLLLVHYYIIYP